MYFFKVPNDLRFGWGAIEALKEVEGKRAFIVTDKIIEQIGFAKRVEDYLLEAGFESVKLVTDVEPDPSRETIEKGAKDLEDFGADWIVGLGGGSAIDAAKAMWVKYEYPEAKWEDILLPHPVPKLRKKAKFISIATTSGTGSEVTFASVVTNRSVTPNVKNVMAGPELCPDLSISDPEFAATMPRSITADTGIDTLTHAIEAYTSVNASEMDKALAIHAIKLVFRSLRKAFANGNDKQARDDMHTASFMAGASFGNAFLGIVHSTAHQLGAQFHVPHGRANSIMLPYVIEYNAIAIPELYAEIARGINLEFDTDKEGVGLLIEAIRDLQEDVDLPLTIKEAGIDEEAFLKTLDQSADYAMKDACTGTNARIPSNEDIVDIYKTAYYGEAV